MKKEMLAALLRQAADKIENGSCSLTAEQIESIFEEVNNEPFTKEQASVFLGMSRSNFDRLVREGKLPAGRKVRGLSSLIWYRRDLERK